MYTWPQTQGSTFKGADENPVREGGAWAGPVYTGGAEMQVQNNAVRSTAGFSSMRYGTSVGANQAWAVQVGYCEQPAGTGLVLLHARLRAGVANYCGYHAGIVGGEVYIGRLDGSASFTRLNAAGLTLADPITSGNQMAIDVFNDEFGQPQIDFWYNETTHPDQWERVDSTTDLTLAYTDAGTFGLECQSVFCWFDNVVGGPSFAPNGTAGFQEVGGAVEIESFDAVLVEGFMRHPTTGALAVTSLLNATPPFVYEEGFWRDDKGYLLVAGGEDTPIANATQEGFVRVAGG